MSDLPNSRKRLEIQEEYHNPRLPLSVIIFEDQKEMAHIFSLLLEESDVFDCTSITVPNLSEAKKILEKQNKDKYFDLIILDLSLPGSYGPQHTVDTIDTLAPDTAVLIVTGLDRDDIAIRRLKVNNNTRIAFKGKHLTAHNLSCLIAYTLAAKLLFTPNENSVPPVIVPLQVPVRASFNYGKYFSTVGTATLGWATTLMLSHLGALEVALFLTLGWLTATLLFLADPNKQIELPTIFKIDKPEDK